VAFGLVALKAAKTCVIRGVYVVVRGLLKIHAMKIEIT
jgi:hypothetical protein